MDFLEHRSVRSAGALLVAAWLVMHASTVWPQASWVGDVIVDGEPSNLWADCLPCTELNEPPNTNWSTDRIPGDDGPLGDPNTGAVIGPDFVVDHNGGTLDLSTLDVQGGLVVGGRINISDSATINNIDLQSGGVLAGPGPVTLTGSGTWNGFLRSGGGVTNEAVLTVETGDLQTDLVNNTTLVINPSLNFTSTPSLLTNNGSILLDTDTALNNSSNILDSSGAANLLLNNGTIAKFGADLSVIEAPGNHAGGLIGAADGILGFFRGNWQFSGGDMQVSNNGQIELTGNVDHVINGTPGINGQGSLLVNMNTSGTLTVTQPFVVNLSGSGEHGLLLEGIGIDLEAALTNRQGGHWSGGLISGAGAGRLVNESPLSDPFRIVSGASKTLNRDLDSMGWIEQSSTVIVNAPHRLMIAPGGGLAILADPASIDWHGNGGIVNAGNVEILPGARSTMDASFSQVDGGQLVSEGELHLRGGGMWSGTTTTFLASVDIEPALSMETSRFEFDSGAHRFLDNGNAAVAQRLVLNSADMVTRIESATVIFDLDEFLGADGQIGRVEMNGGGLGGTGRFENQGHFFWQSGLFGIGDTINFVNTDSGLLQISNSTNELRGLLINLGQAEGGVKISTLSTISNSGLWFLRQNESIGVTDTVSPGTFENAGELLTAATLDGSEFSIAAMLDNTGTIRVSQNSTLHISGPVVQLANGTLTGGTWILGSDSTLVFPEPFTAIGPGTILRGAERISGMQGLGEILGGEATVTGELNLNGSLRLSNGAMVVIDGSASVNVPGGVQNGEPGKHDSITEMLEEALVIASHPEPPDGRVTASASAAKAAAGGTLTPLLTTPLVDNHAILAPGGIGLPGPFNLDGELVMHPGSTLDIDLAGATPVAGHDQLVVTGPLTLAGTVQIAVAEDFFPAVGQQFVIATAGQGMTGMIDDLVNANREDIVWSITETVDEVIVEAVEVERIFESGFES